MKKREEITSAIRFLESNGYIIEKTNESESTLKFRENNDSLVETNQENEEGSAFPNIEKIQVLLERSYILNCLLKPSKAK
ncbi:hypothetical protein AGMMS49579_15670 [Spirochaetia bacterium]|nr:hypothetical protein AGMMS49579_15670 [Spirochaetia bacterium]